MKVIFFISRLFWQDEVFALLQFAHDCDFCQKLAAPQAFQCQQKTDRTAWQLVRSGMLENRLISLSDVFLISSFQIYSWCQPCRYPLSFPFQQVWVRCAQNSTLPTFGELNISSCCAFSRYQYVRHKFMCLLEQGPKQSIFCNISGFENFKPQGFVSKVFASEKFQIYERHTCGQA